MISRAPSKFVGRCRRLDFIPGIQDDEITKLTKANYPDQDALQRVLDKPFSLDCGAESTAICLIAENSGLDKKRVAELLAASLRQSSEPIVSNWLSKHWPDLVVIAFFVMFAMLPIFGGFADTKKKAETEASHTEPQVIAIRELAPYVPLQAGDLQPSKTALPSDASKLVAGFIGHYTTQLVMAGQTINTANISKNKANLKNYSIVRVTLKLKPTLEGASLPSSAKLLLSSRNATQGGAVFPILLLDIEADGVMATIAVPSDQLIEVAKWIGNADAYLSLPVQ